MSGGPFKIVDEPTHSAFMDEPPKRVLTLTPGTWLVWCGAKQKVVHVPPGATQRIEAAGLDTGVDRDRQLAALAEMRESLRAFADSAAKERDALMGEVAKHRARAAELEAERAKANEPRPMITTIKGQAPRLEFAADGQPITYVTPQPEPGSADDRDH